MARVRRAGQLEFGYVLLLCAHSSTNFKVLLALWALLLFVHVLGFAGTPDHKSH